MNLWIVTGLCLTSVLLLGMAGPPISKGAGHHVVFEFVSEEPQEQEVLLNHIEDLLQALGNTTQVLVVAHGGGLGLLHRPEKAIGNRITELAGKRVAFAACASTMHRKNVEKGDLVREAMTVDSGVAEVVRRQEDGWSYIKSGH